MTDSSITDDHLIIANLMGNEEYFKKVIPFLQSEYFHDDNNRKIFNGIRKYTKKYNKIPDYTIIKNIITSSKEDDDHIQVMLQTLQHLENIKLPKDTEYIVDKTEKFCQDRALHNAIYTAYEIYDGTNKKMTVGAIPDLIRDAISISFESSVGHNYDKDGEARWEYYNSTETKIPFTYETLNAITDGGVTLKTFNLIAAGVNVGKTLLLIVLTVMYKELGYDVFYITNEVSDMEVSKRIDASVLGVSTDRLGDLDKMKFLSKLAKIKEKGAGRLFVKEYPTGTCNSLKIESDLQELELKEDFRPTIVINDYVTINASSSMPKSANMYQYYNSIAEELRALAVKYNFAMWSATQLKTSAMESTDVQLSDLADSQGIARTADLVWAVVRHNDLDKERKIRFIQLKTRYHHIKYIKWDMGIDISKHRLSDTKPVIEGVTDIYSKRDYGKKTNSPKKDTLSKDKPAIKINTSKTKKQDDLNEYEQYVST